MKNIQTDFTKGNRADVSLMKKVSLLLAVCALPLLCSASDVVNTEYFVSSMYNGNIGKSNITMNLVTSRGTISGSYVYDKY